MKSSAFPLCLIIAVVTIIGANCKKAIKDPPNRTNAFPNMRPVLNAGLDISIEIPNTSVQLALDVSDLDGYIKEVGARKISGPNSWLFQYEDFPRLVSFVWLEDGVYEFEMTATDNIGQFARDTVRITVKNNFRKYIKYALLPEASVTMVDLPADIHKDLKWFFCRSSNYSEQADKGPQAGIDYSWGGWYYELLQDNKATVFGGSNNEKFDLVIYY